MKKYVVTSLVALSVASITGLTIGLAINRPVQLTTKNTATTQAAPAPTQTSAATTTTTTQAVSQPTPSTTPTPPTTTSPSTATPVTVTAFQRIPLDSNGNIDCELTYSDGTTYQWHWQTVDAHGTWMINGDGTNGHWVATNDHVNICDSSIVGTTKLN